MSRVRVVDVFSDGPGGGNPAPVVLDAVAMTDTQMQELARTYEHECAFVVDPSGTGCDLALRFWVPNHEMSMCGHATLGTVWLLSEFGRLPRTGEATVHTASGVVHARLRHGAVRISQPAGRVVALDASAVAAITGALGITAGDLADNSVCNATTSRTKTLVPLRSVTTLDTLQPRFDRIADVCASINSTGLYPYVQTGAAQFDARQFPRSAGYPEDPATGVAAAALAFGVRAGGVVDEDAELTVRQGRAMGRPARITVRLDPSGDLDGVGCWLGGDAAFGLLQPQRQLEAPRAG